MTRVDEQFELVHAPMAGIFRLLEDVPDPVFAQRLIGDGFAIDPLDEYVRSPFCGTIVNIAQTGHAITVRSHNNVEVLIHVGIDTVGLNGRGFDILVTSGQAVSTGDVLIALDLDLICREAASLLTAVVVVSDHKVSLKAMDRTKISLEDIAFSVMLPQRIECDADHPPPHNSSAYVQYVLRLPHGLHARPSGRIAQLARSFDGTITIGYRELTADATSITALMSLGTKSGSAIEITAVGERSREITIELTQLLDEIADLECRAIVSQLPAAAPGTQPVNIIPMSPSAVPAVVASHGLAIGPVHLWDAIDIEVHEFADDSEAEQRRISNAISAIETTLEDLIKNSCGASKSIAEAHAAILQDKSIRATADKFLLQGFSAEYAWRSASRAQESALEATGDQRLCERVIDLRDVERRMLAQLTGNEAKTMPPPIGSIVICRDMPPSAILTLTKGSVAGICSAQGGATSHAAILAASKSIPMLVAAGENVLRLQDGAIVILDAETGRFDPCPEPEPMKEFAKRISAQSCQALTLMDAAKDMCRLADGKRIDVFANLATLDDAHDAIENGAEGCGLLRTEFMFAESLKAPSETAQKAQYRAFAKAMKGKPLIIRTLDVGGDKPLAYLPFPDEANPALGMRGIRFALAEQDVLRTQIRAMIRSVPGSQLRIMLPMIVELSELLQVRDIVQSECSSLGVKHTIQIGIMVETPAAVLLADQIAAHADFLSIGSNDLSQYILAMDRGNAPLAARVDAYHPAVLRAIKQTADGAAKHGRWLGICGGLASDYKAAPLLVGLGCDELSAVPDAIPRIKQILADWSMDRCRALAGRALVQQSAREVRSLIDGEML
jgi:phosphoenolpyruvate-protein phosphotransferase